MRKNHYPFDSFKIEEKNPRLFKKHLPYFTYLMESEWNKRDMNKERKLIIYNMNLSIIIFRTLSKFSHLHFPEVGTWA